MYDNDLGFALATAGPSLVLLIAVLIAVWLTQRAWTSKRYGARSNIVSRTAPISGYSNELSIALESAATLNAYNVHAQNNPSVHLEAALRLTPLEYQDAAYEIMQRFREGRVVSIDLTEMDHRQAARLVDFCSGMTAVTSGWLFRVTNSVIVLTPLT
jgi:FtsZ-interacting cell division protein YlmF